MTQQRKRWTAQHRQVSAKGIPSRFRILTENGKPVTMNASNATLMAMAPEMADLLDACLDVITFQYYRLKSEFPAEKVPPILAKLEHCTRRARRKIA